MWYGIEDRTHISVCLKKIPVSMAAAQEQRM